MRALWMQVARTGTARGYGLATSLAGTFIMARYLGPEGRGVVAAAIGWVTLFATFAACSISSAIFYLAAGRQENEWLARTFGAVVAITAVATLVAWSVAGGTAVASGLTAFRNIPIPILVLSFSYLPLMVWNESANALLIATGQLDRLNVLQMIAATLTFASVLAFVVALPGGVAGAVLATGVFQLSMAAPTFRVMARRAGSFTVDRGVAGQLLSGGLRVHLSVIATFAVMQAGVLLLNFYRSAAETGHYHLALQLVIAIQMVSVSIAQVAQGVISRDGPDAAWPRQKKLLIQSTVPFFLLSIAGWFLAPLIIRVAGGERFLAAVPILRVLLLSVAATNISMVMSSQWVARGMFLRLTAISAVLGAISLTANYLVIPRYGAMGAAWVATAIQFASILPHAAMAFWVSARFRSQNGTPAEAGHS
jgi:O-antigen/teichoic acid export membrane protein